MITRFGMRSRLLAGAMLLALPATAWASDVTGVVTDASGTASLQGAEVTIVELGRTTQADSHGYYSFSDVAPGTYTLRARYQGAPLFETRIVVPETGELTADIVLGTDSEILVVGQRANLFSALQRERAADGVSSVVTRDAIGQFPDQNVAESLRRLPGVNILDDQGEGRFVSVRGLDPNLNSSSVNGLRLPSPESDVREVALDTVSSDLIESIEVKKSLTPDMDGDTIGASVEIHTTSAFDRESDLYTVKVEGSYNELRDTLTPKGSIDFATRLTDNFGIAGGFSYYQRKFSTDNVETGGTWDTANGVDFNEEVQYRDYDVERKRIGGTLSLDWRPSDTTTLYLRGIYTQFDDHEYRNRLTIISDGDPVSGTDDSALFQPSGSSSRIEVRRDLKDRFESQKVRTITFGGETQTNGWHATYQAGWARSSESEHGSLDPTRFRARFNSGVDINFDYSNPHVPAFTLVNGADRFTDPDNYSFNRIERSALSDSVDQEWSLRGDLARTFAMDGGEFTVQGGVKSRWRVKSYDYNLEYYGDYNGSLGFADLVGNPSYGLADIYPALDWGKTHDFYYDNPGDFELDTEESGFGSAESDYRAKEDVLAGYLLGRWDSSTLRAIGGIRMERTFNRLNGNFVQLENDNCSQEVCVDPVQFTRSYTDWLPSLTLRFEPRSGLVLRAAGYRSLMRPNLSDMAPRFLINDDNEAELGNPDLKPYHAWNFDAAVEYYYADNGAISVNFFYKSIKDFIVDSTSSQGGIYNGMAYDSIDKFPINGETAKVTGVEFSFSQVMDFLPGPLDGLLFQFNYTFTDAKGDVLTDGDPTDPREIMLPSSSRNTFNAVVGYENGPLSLRLAGTYRDKYLDEVGAEAVEDRYVDNHFQLDLTAKFKVTRNIQIYADWININNANYFAYQNYNGRQRLLQYEEYGSTVKFGTRIKF